MTVFLGVLPGGVWGQWDVRAADSTWLAGQQWQLPGCGGSSSTSTSTSTSTEFLELLEHVVHVVQLVVDQLVVDQLVEHVDDSLLLLLLVVVFGDLMDHDHPATDVVDVDDDDVDQRVKHLLDLRHRIVDDDTFQQWRRRLAAAPDVVQWLYWGRATAPHRL